MDLVVNSPTKVIFPVNFHFQVNETISQRSRHTISNTLVSFSVTCGNNMYVVWQFVSTNTAVQNQLISCRLYSRCRRVHFIHEQDDLVMLSSHSLVGQFYRRSPFHLVRCSIKEWNTFNVCRIPQ